MEEPDVVWAYRTYYPLLRQKCGRMLADPTEAQDVAQETFTRLWRSRVSLRDSRAVAGWLYTTSTRLAVERMRGRKRMVFDEADAPGRSDGPERIAAARSGLARVATELAPEDLELLLLWRIDGLEQTEIAEVLGTSERTVRRRLRRAEAALERLGGIDG